MITREIDIAIKDDTALPKKSLIVFAGDRGIRFLLRIESYYKIDDKLIIEELDGNSSSASVRFVKPNSKTTFTVDTEIVDNRVVLEITRDLTDELNEIGDYTVQIHLFNQDKTSRITIPPFKFTVKDLIARFNESDI